MNNLLNYSIASILPNSLRFDPFIIVLGEAFEKELKLAYKEANNLATFNDIETLPENFLDFLAYQKHVDFYDNTLPLEQKRKLIKMSFILHRRKGTPWSVENVVSVVFNAAKVNEWFDYGGNPYLFRLETNESLSADMDLKKIISMIDSTKNKRSKLENITVNRELAFNLNIGAAITEYQITSINPTVFEMPNHEIHLNFGGLLTKYNTTQIEMPLFHMPDFELSQHIGRAFSFWQQTTIYPEVNELGKLQRYGFDQTRS